MIPLPAFFSAWRDAFWEFQLTAAEERWLFELFVFSIRESADRSQNEQFTGNAEWTQNEEHQDSVPGAGARQEERADTDFGERAW